jgi:glycosyltransferase involved in cell wall biosynthesis
VVPTRNRADYLEVALRSLTAQRLDGALELLVVDDHSDDRTPTVIEQAGARAVPLGDARGLNAARNAGLRAASADLVALVDDDISAPAGYAAALVEGAARHPGAEAFGGPIRARFDGPAPRGCGREPAPITTLDLGGVDTEADLVWGTNMALRRSAFERIGPFDEAIADGGDEEDWLRRLQAAGGMVMYIAEAALEHRRAGDDARLRSLARGAYGRGRAMRAYDRRRGTEPTLAHEARVLAGCGWHTLRRACPQGIVMGAHSAGRLVEAVRGG